MKPVPVALSRLEPGQQAVMHVGARVPSLIVGGAIAMLGRVVNDQLGWPSWPGFAIGALVALWLAVITPRRRWRAWGWALAPDELHVAHGTWTQVHTVVPLTRVQHIDVSQGPVERAFGVARLILHTAGTSHAVVVLPGLSRVKAEELRDSIRVRIRPEAW
jgi:membrane protein YdbS with pleckstrin-like domain